jgi:hypothetical protein
LGEWGGHHVREDAEMAMILPSPDKKILHVLKTCLEHAADNLAMYGGFPDCERLTRLAMDRFNGREKAWDIVAKEYTSQYLYDRSAEDALNQIVRLTESPRLANDLPALSERVALALRSGGCMPRKDLLVPKIKELIWDVIGKP